MAAVSAGGGAQRRGRILRQVRLWVSGGAGGLGVARLSLTEKRGVGLGLEQSLTGGNSQGTGSLMYEPHEGSLTGRLQDRYRFSSEWTSDVTGSYQTNSGYFGNTAA